jgi:PAS domain S-box-containing protein
MLNSAAENQLQLDNSELARQISLLEESLQKKELAAVVMQDSEKRYRRLFESAKDGILILDAETGMVVDVNPFLTHLLGYTYDEFCGKFIWEIGAFKDIAASKDAFNVLQNNEYIRYDDLPLETRDGQSVAVEFVSNVYLVDHVKVIQCNIRDITAHKRAKEERKRLMAAIEQAGDSIVMTDAQGIIQFVNPAFEKITGYSVQEAIGQKPSILKSGRQDDLFYQNMWQTISGGKTWSGRLVNKRKAGTFFTEECTISPVRDSSDQIVNYVAVKRDITDHLRLTEQFHQTQKMEAIGQLAGGVAHDFNNMLTVIIGYTELALKKMDPALPLHAKLDEVLKAAYRSADITRQLLAFARKQTIAPIVLDLNLAVEKILTMLRRLIGENIDLAWFPAEGLGHVKMDPVQVDQLLANLCVNARDAIDGVGKITIETANTEFDDIYCGEHEGYIAGEYVMLAVSDNGCGMNKEQITQIFEPFYTSKIIGKGTGLGLSTVYGVVKQNNGFINVYSEPGKGTTFRIYLTLHAEQVIATQEAHSGEIPRGNGETVLLVEDELAILKLGKMMLEKLGYLVLAAERPSEAITLAEQHAGEIQLLITDVVMPEMNGRILAEHLQSICPDTKILFMSGFTADVIAHQGILDEGVNFVQKPFSLQQFAVKVHEVLKHHD